MKLSNTIACSLAVVFFLGTFGANVIAVKADEPDPLALPCTEGATATKNGDKYLCEKCGSETCWIIQPKQQ